jgi:N,N-dimethylformamidase
MSIKLIGYSDKLSVRPGETISFHVSNDTGQNVSTHLTRSISADPNPAGMGIVETNCDAIYPPQEYQISKQEFFPGSYARTRQVFAHNINDHITISITVMPTHLTSGEQSILSIGLLWLGLDADGHINLRYGDDGIISQQPVSIGKWHNITANITVSGQMELNIYQASSKEAHAISGQFEWPRQRLSLDDVMTLAARLTSQNPEHHFNGRIEHPAITIDNKLIAEWNLATNMTALEVPDIGANDALTLLLINAPTRGVCSSQWDASEFSWKHCPSHYAAIHFHDDDIYDFNWNSSFSFTIPQDMASGIYVMRISTGDNEDAMPFFVCAPKAKPSAKLCVLVSTFTYAVYGNHARPDYHDGWLKRIADWGAYPHNPACYKEYGLSTYNNHSDGSGICHASHKRPLFNLRPGYITFGEAECSGLRHFQADSHLISWLHKHHIDYDIITDDELDREGVEAIAGYAAVTTGSHPEYHTQNMLDALMAYRDQGGHLLYLGGNGFYWKIVRHQKHPDLIEIRRAEDGLRAWASQPGEYYNSFDGSYGGLWRRNGRPPQQLVGIGFTAQGVFEGHPYKRTCFDPEFDWLFDGIESDEIGNFGFSGNGAAGFELDRVDPNLEDSHHITILAQSFANEFMLVPEEHLTHLTNLSGGSEDAAKRADMVYFETPSGGKVFSTGSITFCGSLPWNHFDNNVSRLLLNVVKRFTNPS